MDNVSIVGIDLAKQSFQLNGASPDGSGVFCKRLSRPQLLAFLAEFLIVVLRCKLAPLPPFQGREIGKLDHETRLILPVCVTPFVKRPKTVQRRLLALHCVQRCAMYP